MNNEKINSKIKLLKNSSFVILIFVILKFRNIDRSTFRLPKFWLSPQGNIQKWKILKFTRITKQFIVHMERNSIEFKKIIKLFSPCYAIFVAYAKSFLYTSFYFSSILTNRLIVTTDNDCEAKCVYRKRIAFPHPIFLASCSPRFTLLSKWRMIRHYCVWTSEMMKYDVSIQFSYNIQRFIIFYGKF